MLKAIHFRLFLAGLISLSFTNLCAATLTVNGTLQFEKIVYTRPLSTNLAQTTINSPVRQAVVKAFEGATELASTATDNTGAYSFSVTFTSSFNLIVYTSGTGISVKTEGVAGTEHSVNVATTATTAGPHDLTITTGNNSGAFNVYDQLVRGRDFLAAAPFSLSFTRTITCLYPHSLGTFFSPSDFSIGIASPASDPDEFDDDIILHEFGHMAADEFSADNSRGGQHTVNGQYDLRLSWSEGLAHFISSAIRADSEQVDSSGQVNADGTTFYTNTPFDIANPTSSIVGADIEWSVANVLWRAYQEVSNTTVFTTLTSFKSLPASISSDPISMDTFRDLWTGSSLDSIYTARGMSYAVDDMSSNTSSSPLVINNPSLYVNKNLTFFGNGDVDYFLFSGTANKNYELETGITVNGALTTINIYKNVLGSAIASNDQRNGLSTDTNSYIFFQADETTNYLVQVLRFSSTTQNYGLGESASSGTAGSYTQTVGRYGGYAFGLREATATSSTPSNTWVATTAESTNEATSTSGTSSTTSTTSATTNTTSATSGDSTNSDTATADSGGGGGGGGCFLMRRSR